MNVRICVLGFSLVASTLSPAPWCTAPCVAAPSVHRAILVRAPGDSPDRKYRGPFLEAQVDFVFRGFPSRQLVSQAEGVTAGLVGVTRFRLAQDTTTALQPFSLADRLFSSRAVYYALLPVVVPIVTLTFVLLPLALGFGLYLGLMDARAWLSARAGPDSLLVNSLRPFAIVCGLSVGIGVAVLIFANTVFTKEFWQIEPSRDLSFADKAAYHLWYDNATDSEYHLVIAGRHFDLPPLTSVEFLVPDGLLEFTVQDSARETVVDQGKLNIRPSGGDTGVRESVFVYNLLSRNRYYLASRIYR
jgi:hypothetical protein